MSADLAPSQRLTATALAEALVRYQFDFDTLVASYAPACDYRLVTHELHDIRSMKEGLPDLSYEMANVLIRHVELVHTIWNAHARPRRNDPYQIGQVRQRHGAAVEAMRSKCVQLAERAGPSH